MILKIRHKGLRRFYETGDASGIDAKRASWIRIVLTALDTANNPASLNMPGFRLHALKQDRKGQWAITISGNWRLVFEFDGDDITNVDLVDYH